MHFTEGVKALHWPIEVFESIGAQFVARAHEEGVFHRRGHFGYWPAYVLHDGRQIEVVISVFSKTTKLMGSTAKEGDVGITLRSEWNPSQNPLD